MLNKQQLEERYNELPSVLKNALFSVEIAEKIFSLGGKYGISIENNSYLAEEIGHVILGFTPIKEFPKKLQDKLGLLDDEIDELIKDINKEILFPIREALKSAHNIEIDVETTFSESSSPETTSPVNPVRTGAPRMADGSITLPSAISTTTADGSRQRSNGVKTPVYQPISKIPSINLRTPETQRPYPEPTPKPYTAPRPHTPTIRPIPRPPLQTQPTPAILQKEPPLSISPELQSRLTPQGSTQMNEPLSSSLDQMNKPIPKIQIPTPEFEPLDLTKPESAKPKMEQEPTPPKYTPPAPTSSKVPPIDLRNIQKTNTTPQSQSFTRPHPVNSYGDLDPYRETLDKKDKDTDSIFTHVKPDE